MLQWSQLSKQYSDLLLLDLIPLPSGPYLTLIGRNWREEYNTLFLQAATRRLHNETGLEVFMAKAHGQFLMSDNEIVSVNLERESLKNTFYAKTNTQNLKVSL